MPTNWNPKITISLANTDPAKFKDVWRQGAYLCGFRKRKEGSISNLLIAIAELPEEDRKLLWTFIKGLLSNSGQQS